jgi:hypothetical protein
VSADVPPGSHTSRWAGCCASRRSTCEQPGPRLPRLQVTNVLFRMGAAAMLFSNKASMAQAAKYDLLYNHRVHIAANDDAYRWGGRAAAQTGAATRAWCVLRPRCLRLPCLMNWPPAPGRTAPTQGHLVRPRRREHPRRVPWQERGGGGGPGAGQGHEAPGAQVRGRPGLASIALHPAAAAQRTSGAVHSAR